MESGYSCQTRDRKEAHDRNALSVRMIELAKTKEDLRQAKDDMAQLGLDARPLVDKLEKLKSNLATTKSRILMSNTFISELAAELETTKNSLRFKTDIESKLRLKASEVNQSLDQMRVEIELLQLEKDKQRRTRTELEQAVRLKKQSLKKLQLTLRAIRLESEAIGASVTGAVTSIYCSDTDPAIVELSRKEYYALVKKAEEETLLADWRISVSLEQRLVAEQSRDLALRRLKEISKTKLRERENNEQQGEGLYAIKDGEEKSKIKAEIEVIDKEVAYPKAQPELIEWSSKESSLQLKRSRRYIERSVQRKKPSVLVRIRSCLIQKVAIWFR